MLLISPRSFNLPYKLLVKKILNPWTVSHLETDLSQPLCKQGQIKSSKKEIQRRNKEPTPLLLRSLVTAVTDSADGSSGVGSLVTTRVLKVVFNDD